jgi:hypothetical protein
VWLVAVLPLMTSRAFGIRFADPCDEFTLKRRFGSRCPRSVQGYPDL